MQIFNRLLFLLLLSFCVNSSIAQPVAGFTASKTSGCSPLSVQFTDLSTGNPTSFSWSFGNGNNSVIQHPSALYIVPGVYNVSLTVSNANGSDVKSITAYITVFASPVADFTSALTGGCAPLPVQFTDQSTLGSAPVSTWLWDFGDGSIGGQQNPLHTYTSTGPKNVSLTITDTNGCANTITKPAMVTVTQTHTADFTVSNNRPCKAPSTHTLTSTVVPANPGYTYEWTTTNSQTSTQQHPVFNFTGTGSLGITLKVTAPSGCAAYVTKPQAVYTADIQSDYTAPVIPLCDGARFMFQNTSTPDTGAVVHLWSLNGAANVTVKDFISNLGAGTHSLRLISRLGLCTDTITKTFTVNPNPVASFTNQPQAICAVPSKVGFTSTSTGTGLSYNWDFGNGQSSVSAADSATYSILTGHTVRLIVKNSFGCSDTVFNVLPAIIPTAVIKNRNTKRGCKAYTAVFEVGNPTEFSTFQWIYQGNTIGTTSSFNHIFNDTGLHVVRLKATNAAGCVSEVYDSVYVGQVLTFDFTANKRTGCFSMINPVQFTLNETSGIANLKYNWQWKNGGDNSKNPLIYFTDTGLYNMVANIDHNGCISLLQKNNYISVYPARARMENPEVNCSNDSIFFNGSLSYGANRFLWLFGDGGSSELKSPKHLYHSSGTFTVKLIVFDTLYNCPDTGQVELVIPEAPQLSFTVSDSLACSPFVAQLNNTTTVGPNGYQIISTSWLFSTGEPATGKNANVVLSSFGYRGLTMTATDARNCIYTLSKDSVVKVIGGTAKLNLNVAKGCTPLLVEGKDTSVTEYPVVHRKWVWTAADSTLSGTHDTASFVFENANNPQSAGFNIRYVITDSFGCEFTTFRNVIPSNPVPEINVSRVLSCGSQIITTNANTSAKNVLPMASYTWNFGAGNVSGPSVVRNYSFPDTILNCALMITDGNGCTKFKDTALHIVNLKPKPGFFANPQKLDCYLPITPIKLIDTTITGAAPVTEWFWTFGSNNSILKSPEIAFTKPGRYGVSLVIKDGAGCIDSVVMPDYLVLGGPVGSYSFTPRAGCLPHDVEFSVLSPNARYFIWDMGDGLVDTLETNIFTHKYPNQGVYYPRLTLIDSSGTCAYGYDAIDSITVHALPCPDFVADKQLICYNTNVTITNTTPEQSKIASWRWQMNQVDSSYEKGPLQVLFTKGGFFTVSLMATDTNGCVDSIIKPDFIKVIDDTIAPLIPVTIRATVEDNTSNLFEFSRNHEIDFSHYLLYYDFSGSAAGAVSPVYNIDDTTFTQFSINTLINPYSYAVASVDVCGNVSDTGIIHTTVELKARETDNAIRLDWTPYAGFDTIARYEIWRNNPDSGTTYVRINEVAPLQLFYLDTSITCFTTYYYRIKTIRKGAPEVFSWSDTSGAVPVYVPTMPGTRNIRATVVNDSYVLLEWQQRVHKIKFTYVVFRMRDDEKEPAFLLETEDTFLVDMDTRVDEHSYTYYTYLRDECGGLSTSSNTAKTILLKVDLRENDLLRYDPVISFTPYEEWAGGVNKYSADFYYDSARAFHRITELHPDDTSFFHKYVNLQQRDYCYKVTAEERAANNVYSESNIACVETKPRLYAPNVFTINNDGINDRFELGGVFLDTYHLVIYNRWGDVVFESFDIHNSWDGTFNGEPCAPDVYVYMAEGTGRKNQRISIKGNVTLLR